MWDSRIATVIISLNGHKSAITVLTFDKSGVRLASGAHDTDIIIWDLVAEVGLFKLRGHKNQITALRFLQPNLEENDAATNRDIEEQITRSNGFTNANEESIGYLLSTSKDSLIKIWDLSIQHCIETHVAQSNGECWALCVSPSDDGCVTAGNDGELKVWSIDVRGLREVSLQAGQHTKKNYLHERGTIYRQGKDRTIGLAFHPHGGYIAAHGSEKAIEFWRIRSENEVRKTLARKRRRRREKEVVRNGQSNEVIVDNEKVDDISSADITEVIIPHVIVRTGGKVRSFDWAGRTASKKILQILVATTNNQLEKYKIFTKLKEKKKSEEPPEYDRTFSVDIPGHRADVRSVALSSDDRMVISASNGALKVWNVRTQTCIRTLECGYALCSSFLPGDKIVVVGNRNGELELFDIASSTLIDTVKAHEGPVWTLHVSPDGKSVTTGSADKSAKFWNFEIIQKEIPGTKRTSPQLKLVHNRTLKVADDILSLRYSPDARFLAVALLDNTVKVFFVDSLKLYLNLYGHKLPVLNMDISYDSKLIVTCSADKNVRLWGLDFGDCHKAFFAHQDSIMQVAFVPNNQDGNGHHFFSASKDRLIKYWDGDKFEQIQRLDGHHGEIWAMTVSRTGEFVISASHDKSIRVWQQTDEQIFLEEEREKELEELYENTLTTSLEQDEENGAEKSEVVAAGKQNVETLMASEKITEALEIGIPDLQIMEEWRIGKATNSNLAPPQRDTIFFAYGNISAEEHVLNTIQKIKAASLQDALLVLAFEKVTALLTFMRIWAEKQWNIPLTCRVLFFMLKTHHRQIVASKTMRSTLDGIRVGLRKALQQQKDEMGFNLAALRFVGGRLKEKGTKEYVDEEVWEKEEEKTGKGRKKRAFVDVA